MRGYIQAKATNPLDQDYTVMITLSISDWILFLEQMRTMKASTSYPAWHIIDGINNVVKNAEEVFSTSITAE